jgi:bifunctional oligoribonuclease and PAP phosphatase NrnA
MRHFEAFKELLSSPKRIVITTHHKPDADALGSSLGLASFLTKKHHQVHVITPTDYPKFLHWMHGNDEVIVFNEGNEERSRKLVDEAEVIFCLDFSCLSRINELGKMVDEANTIKVLIDHHENKEDFADFELWDIKAAATCELVYDLIVELGERYLIDKAMSECLYAGIMTDTGSFRHPNTTRHVHEIVANLIDLGADVAKISKLIYDNNSVDRLRFMGYALSEKLVVLPEYKTAYFVITADELKKFNSRTGDTEGLVNYALSIEGITMAAVIIDRPDGIRLSFRSIGKFAVNDLAAKHFDGGGHKNAAGGSSELSLEETEKKFLKLLPLYKEQLHKYSLIPETQIEHEKVE